MITQAEYTAAKNRAIVMIRRAGIMTTKAELKQIEVADFGLSELEISGAQILTLVDTDNIAVKVLAMFHGQTEPEHTHTRLDDYAGKEETIRCEWGELYIYSPGEPTPNPACRPPEHRKETYTVWYETILRPGDQITFPPDTPHWFQGGPEGSVIWSFSTQAVDAKDVFADPNVIRETKVIDSEK